MSSLREEHSLILKGLYTLDRDLGKLESSPLINARRILSRLQGEGEKLASDLYLHFEKEEKVLYPLLEKRLAKNAEPVAVMRKEHIRLSGCIAALNSLIERTLKDHETVRTWELSSKLQDLRSELSDHISREERVLFWLAEVHLSRSDINKLSSRLLQMRSTPSETAPC